ncbi:MAG: MBOAT family protein [Clostridia bacterium]|nr:MBOAT family protein [Clostridia bacterium]
MVFSSLSFLFFFLPTVLIAYFALPWRRAKNTVLLIFSLFFYAWGEPKVILLMIAATLVAYFGGLLGEKYGAEGRTKAKKAVFILTVCLITSALAVFKYLNFAVENIESLFSVDLPFKEIALPIGISFYTFQILSYCIDLYRGQVSLQRNFFDLLLYVSLFPQLIAGPIVRYSDVDSELSSRKETLDDVAAGLRRFSVGLAKKVILSNNIAAISTLIYSGNTDFYGSGFYWLAALAYALHIYFDFSGYSDMAIGLGRVFGFRFGENFNYPYTATSVTDFWRRWHISLSSWFRDYIYIPLGGNRVSRSRWIFNICAVWLLTGLWHGAEWNFVLWGGYYALLLLIDKLFLGKLLARLPKLLSGLFTFFWVTLGWVLFNADGLAPALENLRIMFSGIPSDVFAAVAADSSLLYALIYIPLGLVCIFPWAKRIKLPDSLAGESLKNAASLALFGMSLVYLVSSGFNPFIYFRF